MKKSISSYVRSHQSIEGSEKKATPEAYLGSSVSYMLELLCKCSLYQLFSLSHTCPGEVAKDVVFVSLHKSGSREESLARGVRNDIIRSPRVGTQPFFRQSITNRCLPLT